MKRRKLSSYTISCLRGRLGMDDLTDTSQDDTINAMPALEIVRKYFGWKLGDENWGDNAIHVIEEAYAIKLKEPKLCPKSKTTS